MPLNSAWFTIEGCEWRAEADQDVLAVTPRYGYGHGHGHGHGLLIYSSVWVRGTRTHTDTETDMEAVKWGPKTISYTSKPGF